MRKFLFLLWCMIAMAGYAEVNQTTSKGSFRVVTSKVVGYHKNQAYRSKSMLEKE